MIRMTRKASSDRCCSRKLPPMMRRSKSLGSIPRYTLGRFRASQATHPPKQMPDRSPNRCAIGEPRVRDQASLLPCLGPQSAFGGDECFAESVNLVVYGLRIGHCPRDFFSHKLAVSFAQTMNERLYPTQTHLELIGHFLVGR